MAPGQKCHKLWHFCPVWPCRGQAAHVLQVSRTEALHPGKLAAQIPGQPVDDFRSPTLGLLSGENVTSDGPVKEHQLPADGQGSAGLGCADALFSSPRKRNNLPVMEPDQPQAATVRARGLSQIKSATACGTFGASDVASAKFRIKKRYTHWTALLAPKSLCSGPAWFIAISLFPSWPTFQSQVVIHGGDEVLLRS